MTTLGIVASSTRAGETVYSTSVSYFDTVVLNSSPNSYWTLAWRVRDDRAMFDDIVLEQDPDSYWSLDFARREWIEATTLDSTVSAQVPNSHWSLVVRDRTDGLTFDETIVAQGADWFLSTLKLDIVAYNFDDTVIAQEPDWFLPTNGFESHYEFLIFDALVVRQGPSWFLPTVRQDTY